MSDPVAQPQIRRTVDTGLDHAHLPGRSGQMSAPSTRFSGELRMIARNARDLANLRALLLDCLQRHRHGIDAIWFGPANAATRQVLVQRLGSPNAGKRIVKSFVARLIEQAVGNRSDVVMTHPDPVNLIGMAIHVPVEQSSEMIVLLRPTVDQKTIDHDVLAGHHVADAVRYWSLRQDWQQGIDKLDATCAILDLVSRIESADCVEEASRILADSVRDYLDCSFVAVGLKGAGQLTSRIQAVSGVADFDHHSVRSQRIKAALDESINRNEPSRWSNFESQSSTDYAPGQNLAQHKLADHTHCAYVASIPLHDLSDNVTGAITVGGKQSLSAQRVTHFLTTVDHSVGNAMSMVRRTQSSVPRRVIGRAFASSRLKFIAFVLVMIAIAALMWLPIPYRIATRFECQSVQRRSAVAPYEGLLKETLVRPGDVVTAGQALAVMDDRELRFELSGIVAEMERARTEQKIQFANEEIGASLMASLEVQQVKSRRELIEHRLEHLVIRSSIDGLVVSGGIDRKENYPVRVGEMLYEIAPLDRIRFDIAVPAEEIDHVAVGMKVELTADRRVNETIEGKINRIRPRSESIDGDNVFVVEVEIDNEPFALRPGMEGSARIVSKSKRMGWVFFHRAYDHVVSRWRW